MARIHRNVLVALGLLLLITGLVAFAVPTRWAAANGEDVQLPRPTATRLGINLFGLATFNRQQVFTNMILQSEWFSSRGQGWTAFPDHQLDENGWVRFLEPGQTAPRPLMLPPAPYRATTVRCRFAGQGVLSAGGAARAREPVGDQALVLDLALTGTDDEGAWIELLETDPANPVRDIDCREAGRPAAERFHPEFLSFVRPFRIVRFLDWQRTNDNVSVQWENRTRPDSASQVGAYGAAVEDMIDLANITGVDPWFLMPYRADDAYVRQFAQLVHERLAPDRRVYVELGNEIWNDMFDAAQQAQREGLALGLGKGDPARAKMLRYAQKLRQTMRIWTEVFADQPDRLVRVASSQNAWPDLARMMLEDGDTPQWIDALATAPYVWLDLDRYSSADIDRVFAAMPAAVADTIDHAEIHRKIAHAHDLRFLTYEGGQHLVTRDMAFARAIQRDARMGALYRNYLSAWQDRIGGDLVLYASTAPISEYGAWGLREYAGQPLTHAPKLAAVRQFIGTGE